MKSLSDNNTYPDFCLRASQESQLFARFRQRDEYRAILEHVTREQGEEYYKFICENELDKHMERFVLNDLVGGPQMFRYGGHMVSPSTLRYAKVLCDLLLEFDNLDGLNICEIGAGYGGQCRIIHSMFRPKSYTMVDIYPALQLARRYLDNYPINGVLEFKTMNELDFTKFDLVISNYAFTELPGDIQAIYWEKVIKLAKNGYITFNKIVPPEFKSMTKQEILENLPWAKEIAEQPLTHPDNCIIVW